MSFSPWDSSEDSFIVNNSPHKNVLCILSETSGELRVTHAAHSNYVRGLNVYRTSKRPRHSGTPLIDTDRDEPIKG